MGELVVNMGFGDWDEDDGAGGTTTVWGAWQGDGSVPVHTCAKIATQTQAAADALAADAVSAGSAATWISGMSSGAFKTWLSNRPSLVKTGIWLSAKRY